jgi:hypothetical protein
VVLYFIILLLYNDIFYACHHNVSLESRPNNLQRNIILTNRINGFALILALRFFIRESIIRSGFLSGLERVTAGKTKQLTGWLIAP